MATIRPRREEVSQAPRMVQGSCFLMTAMITVVIAEINDTNAHNGRNSDIPVKTVRVTAIVITRSGELSNNWS